MNLAIGGLKPRRNVTMSKKAVVYALVLICALGGLYAYSKRDYLPDVFGLGNGMSLGPYQIKMKYGWHPFGQTATSVTLVYDLVLVPIRGNAINIRILENLSPVFANKISNNITLYKTFRWGVVYNSNPGFAKNVFGLKDSLTRKPWFIVRDKNLIIEAMSPEDLEEIESITLVNEHKSENKLSVSRPL